MKVEVFWAVMFVVADALLVTSVFNSAFAAPGYVLFAIVFLRQRVW